MITLYFFRHWKELMEKTGVFFEMTETFTLENMFAMELHKHTEVLNEIVTAAVKEVAIEKVGRENLWFPCCSWIQGLSHARQKLCI